MYLEVATHPVRVVQVDNLAAFLVHFLVTLAAAAHLQSCIHVDVMAGKIKTDQTLEDNTPSGERLSQEDEQAGSRASVCYHV